MPDSKKNPSEYYFLCTPICSYMLTLSRQIIFNSKITNVHHTTLAICKIEDYIKIGDFQINKGRIIFKNSIDANKKIQICLNL